MDKLEICIPPRGFEQIMANYRLGDYTRDISILADSNAMQSLKGVARLRVEYYTALLRYTAARCARAAAQNRGFSDVGSGPMHPEFYLVNSMGDAFNKDLVANEWEELQKMCPHLMGWKDNGDGTETCNGCSVTVVSKTKYDTPQIVETPPKPKQEMIVGKAYDCKRCHRHHPPGPCENFTGAPLVEALNHVDDIPETCPDGSPHDWKKRYPSGTRIGAPIQWYCKRCRFATLALPSGTPPPYTIGDIEKKGGPFPPDSDLRPGPQDDWHH